MAKLSIGWLRFRKAWGNAQSEGKGGPPERPTVAKVHSSQTRPAIPGEADASGARFRFAGWGDYSHEPLVLQDRVHGAQATATARGAENKKALLNPVN